MIGFVIDAQKLSRRIYHMMLLNAAFVLSWREVWNCVEMRRIINYGYSYK